MLSNSFVVIMIIIILILALAIILLANVLLGAAQIPAPEPPAPEETAPTYADGIARTAGAGAPVPASVVALLLFVALLFSGPGYAKGPAGSQITTSAISVSSAVNGVSDTAFYMITGVVLLEVIILLTLLYNVKLLLSIHKKRQAATAAATPGVAVRPVKPHVSLWERMNRF